MGRAVHRPRLQYIFHLREFEQPGNHTQFSKSGPIQVPIRPRQRKRSRSRSPPMIYDYPSSYRASHPPAPISTSIPPLGVQAVGQPYPAQPPDPTQVPIVHIARSRSRSYSPSYRTRSSYDNLRVMIVEPPQEYRSQSYRQPTIAISSTRNDEDNAGRLRKVWRALTKII